MQSNDPTENCYVYDGCLVLDHQKTVHSPDIMNYLRQTFQYIPVSDENKTIIIGKELFLLTCKLNLFIIQSISGQYTDPPSSYLRKIVKIIGEILKKIIPNQKILNIVKYKLIFYGPDNVQLPIEFMKEEVRSIELFSGKVLPKPLRMYIRNLIFKDNGDIEMF